MISFTFLLTTAVLAIAVFSTMLALFLLLREHQSHSPANYFLMLWLIIICVFVVMLFLIDTRLILRVPWLYRLPSPLYYLAFPAAWMYVRMVLQDETTLKKWDLLHALPALLHLVEMMPFFLSHSDQKMATLLDDLNTPLGGFRHAEGWLPTYNHNIFRGLQGIAYALGMFTLLKKSAKNTSLLAASFAKVTKWLKTIATLQLAFGITMVAILAFDGWGTEAYRSFVLYIMLGLYCIFWGTYLVLHPEIIKAIPQLEKKVLQLCPQQPEVETTTSLAKGQRKAPLAEGVDLSAFPDTQVADGKPHYAMVEPPLAAVYSDYQQLLHLYMEQQKPYLEARYSLSRLAIDLKIPKHHLTFLFNKVMNTGFTEYINQRRIEHITIQIAEGALNNHTLEALALEAGFNSRITFIRAVQRATGKNPSVFFKAVPPNQ